jgi:hypothetical protein
MICAENADDLSALICAVKSDANHCAAARLLTDAYDV